MHVKLDGGKFDNHIVNPNCGKWTATGHCDEDLEHHFILDRRLGPGEGGAGYCRDLVKYAPLLSDPADDTWDPSAPATCDHLSGKISFWCGSGPTPLEVLHASGGAEEENGAYHLEKGYTHNGRQVWKKVGGDEERLLFFSSATGKWYVSDEFEDAGYLNAESAAAGPLGLSWKDPQGPVGFTLREPVALIVDDSECHELLPFSVIYQHDTSARGQELRLPWEGRPALRASALELASYTCGRPPPQLVMEETAFKAANADPAYEKAVEACARSPECGAVALLPSGGRVQLLRGFSCTPPGPGAGGGGDGGGFAAGERVRWRGPEVPGKGEGRVLKPWHCEGAQDDWVHVEFGGSRLRLPADGLERVVAAPTSAWTLTQIVRERHVECHPMRPWYSCDVSKASDAAILFHNGTASAEACRLACKAKMERSSLLEGCCVLAGGVCAIARGEYFPMALDAGGHSVQTEHNADPDAFEAASVCRVTPCSLDPKCTLGAAHAFEAPPDAPVDGGEVALYFDFAHPLSMPFTFAQGGQQSHAALFHLTAKDMKALKVARKEPHRLLRVVGGLPADSPILSAPPAKSETRLYSVWASSGPGVRGARSHGDTVKEAQALLDSACDAHGAKLGRHLRAPRLDLALASREECAREHTDVHSSDFEPCLVRVGCRRLEPEGNLLPFHGPWFSKLPFDILAWQQPAPFCCGKPYTVDHQAEELRKRFFDEIGIDALGEDELEGVSDTGARDQMRSSMKLGSDAIRHFLVKYAPDEETLVWIAGFVKHANTVLMRFMRDFEETVDSEGGGDRVEVAEDGQSFLHIHEDGDQVAPSGRRAVEVARWSDDRGAFLQVALRNSTLADRVRELARLIPGAVYQYGLQPIWKHVFAPLTRWGISATKWCIQHPRAALFTAKLALSVRDRLCEKASHLVYGSPEVEAVGLFTKVSGDLQRGRAYLAETLTPAVLLTGLSNLVANSDLFSKMKSLGEAAFSLAMSWAGFATGGAASVLLGSMASMLADAAADGGKQALEIMVYKEIAKEIPSNLFDMVTKRCLYERGPMKALSATATAREVSDAAVASVSMVSDQLAEQGRQLARTMKNFEHYFASAPKK